MLVCIIKATNRIIEMQEYATKGTLLKNAIAAGYAEEDIEEKKVSSIDYAVALEKDPITIAAKADALLKYQTQQAKENDIATYLPSWEKVSNAVDNLSSLEEAKAFIKKLSRIVYWLAKNSKV